MTTSLPPRRGPATLEQIFGNLKSEVSTSPGAPIAGRHDEFYLTDEMVVFQVEERLFRVPQCLFALNSPIFKSMFSLPPGDHDGGVIEGKSDANPICLASVTVLEFETLLQCLLKGMHHDFDLSQSRWITLLSIAHRYEFLSVCKRAVYELFDRPASERQSSPSESEPGYAVLISVAEKYDVPLQHVLPAIIGLVMRAESLMEVEVVHLSTLTICRLGRAREEYVRATVRRSMNFEGRVTVAKDIVRDIWGAAQG